MKLLALLLMGLMVCAGIACSSDDDDATTDTASAVCNSATGHGVCLTFTNKTTTQLSSLKTSCEAGTYSDSETATWTEGGSCATTSSIGSCIQTWEGGVGTVNITYYSGANITDATAAESSCTGSSEGTFTAIAFQ